MWILTLARTARSKDIFCFVYLYLVKCSQVLLAWSHFSNWYRSWAIQSFIKAFWHVYRIVRLWLRPQYFQPATSYTEFSRITRTAHAHQMSVRYPYVILTGENDSNISYAHLHTNTHESPNYIRWNSANWFIIV